MQCVGNYKKIFMLLAIAGVFSTVASEQVLAQDLELITNVVYSSQSTGGLGQNGKDGEDGKDGKPGADGTSGGDSGDVINLNGKSSASINVESMNGKSVVKIEATPSFKQGSSSVITLHTTSSTTVEAGSLSSQSSTSALFALRDALFSLQSMIVNYVNLLF